jgi:hypothetical protein
LIDKYITEITGSDLENRIIFKSIQASYKPPINNRYAARMLTAKVFYFAGYEFLEQGRTAKTKIYWEQARKSGYDIDYYQRESAALEYYLLKKPDKARKILEDCLKNQYTKISCQNQLNLTLDYLDLPGSLKPEIEKISLQTYRQ